VSTFLESVTEVRAVAGPVPELELKTRAPFPLLLARLANVAVVPAGFDPEAPTGTGPYRWFGGAAHTGIVLRTWEGYWGPRPDVDEIELVFADTEELLDRPELLQSLDFVPRVTRELLDRLPLDDTWHIIRTRSTSTTILGINVARPPFGDPRVRQAIDLAIDRRSLIGAAYPDGAADVAVSLAPPEVFGFLMTDEVGGASPAEARALLADAGVAAGTTCRLQHAGLRPAAVEELVQDLGAVGLDVKSAAIPYDQFYRSFESGIDADLFLFGWSFRFADASELLDSLVHTRGGDQLLGRLNASGYSSPDVDLWIQEALHEPRSAERLKLLRSALSRVAQDRPYIPLYHPGRYALLRTDLEVTDYPGSWLRPQDILRARPAD
jgi:peptide/nickel transport system substrate-binding protein